MVSTKVSLLCLLSLLCSAVFSSAQSVTVSTVALTNVGPFNVDENTEFQLLQPTQPARHIGVGAVPKMVMLSSSIAYLSSVNGGIWRTDDFHNDTAQTDILGAHWRFVSDGCPCQLVGAFDVLPLANGATNPALLAYGCGSYSSFEGSGGEPGRVMISEDGGATWTVTSFHTMIMSTTNSKRLQRISGLRFVPVSSGITRIVVSSDQYYDDTGLHQGGGVWYTEDKGATWTNTYTSASGVLQLLPDAVNLNGFAVNPNLLWMQENNFLAPIYFSNDGGKTFTAAATGMNLPLHCYNSTDQTKARWDGTRMNTAFATTRDANGAGGTFLALYASDAQTYALCYIYYYTSWSSFTSAPSFQLIAGGPDSSFLTDQGYAFFAALADPGQPTTFYFAGFGSFQWRLDLTSQVSAIGNWTRLDLSTASQSKTHGDTRFFVWDQYTNPPTLISTDDGGLWRRATPRTDGDYTRLNGNLAINEPVMVAYDWRSHTVMSASQDNCVLVEYFDVNHTDIHSGQFYSLIPGDGVFTTIDTVSNPSVFYSSTQQLQSFTGVKLDGSNSWLAANNVGFLGIAKVESVVGSTAPDVSASVNPVNTSQVVLCGAADCAAFTFAVPSTNVFSAIPLNIAPTILPFKFARLGGMKNGVPQLKMLVGVSSSNVFTIRDWSDKSTVVSNITAPWSQNVLAVIQLQINAANCDQLAVVVVGADFRSRIYASYDFGVTWLNIDGNLLAQAGAILDFYAGGIAFVQYGSAFNQSAIVVGTYHGLYTAFATDHFCSSSANVSACSWYRMDSNLPNSAISSLFYEPHDDTLAVGVLGRGVWITPSSASSGGGKPTLSSQLTATWTSIAAAAAAAAGGGGGGGGSGGSSTGSGGSNIEPASWDTVSTSEHIFIILGIVAGAFIFCLVIVCCTLGKRAHTDIASLRASSQPIPGTSEFEMKPMN